MTTRVARVPAILAAAFLLWGCGPSPRSQPPAPPKAAAPPQQAPGGDKQADLRIPDLDRSALEPDMRAPTEVLPGEKSSFGFVAEPEAPQASPVRSESEEDKIRRVLALMPVRGLAGQDCGNRVLLGSMPLEKGDIVPRLFESQALVLRVAEVTDRKVLLVITNDGQQIPLSFDLAPRVRSVLPGVLLGDVAEFDESGRPKDQELRTPAIDQISGRLKAAQEKVRDVPRRSLGESYAPSTD
jgi:hypothetical protein